MANLSTYLDSEFGGSLTDDVTLKGGVASIVDGGTIAHGLAAAPTRVSLTPSNGLHVVAVTAISSTLITVAIKVATSGAAVAVAENVYWLAGV